VNFFAVFKGHEMRHEGPRAATPVAAVSWWVDGGYFKLQELLLRYGVVSAGMAMLVVPSNTWTMGDTTCR
jgi:hypothetical protein